MRTAMPPRRKLGPPWNEHQNIGLGYIGPDSIRSAHTHDDDLCDSNPHATLCHRQGVKATFKGVLPRLPHRLASSGA